MFVHKNTKHNDVLRFIELYRTHAVLWNMNLSSYRRNDLKIKAYESIGVETKMSVDEVKKKIKSLRTKLLISSNAFSEAIILSCFLDDTQRSIWPEKVAKIIKRVF